MSSICSVFFLLSVYSYFREVTIFNVYPLSPLRVVSSFPVVSFSCIPYPSESSFYICPFSRLRVVPSFCAVPSFHVVSSFHIVLSFHVVLSFRVSILQVYHPSFRIVSFTCALLRMCHLFVCPLSPLRVVPSFRIVSFPHSLRSMYVLSLCMSPLPSPCDLLFPYSLISVRLPILSCYYMSPIPSLCSLVSVRPFSVCLSSMNVPSLLSVESFLRIGSSPCDISPGVPSSCVLSPCIPSPCNFFLFILSPCVPSLCFPVPSPCPSPCVLRRVSFLRMSLHRVYFHRVSFYMIFCMS